MPKESFFIALDFVPIVYNRPYIYTGDKYLWKRLFKFE